MMVSDLINNCHRQQHKTKAFDPVSVDNINIVDDWVVDRSALISGQAEQSNWMEINQPVNNITSMGPSDDDEFESFIEGKSLYITLLPVYLMLMLKFDIKSSELNRRS